VISIFFIQGLILDCSGKGKINYALFMVEKPTNLISLETPEINPWKKI